MRMKKKLKKLKKKVNRNGEGKPQKEKICHNK